MAIDGKTMKRFVINNSQDVGDDPLVRDGRHVSSRPATAQTMRNAHDDPAHDTFGTNSDDFDLTHQSVDTEGHMDSDGSQVEQEFAHAEGQYQVQDNNIPYNGQFDGYFQHTLPTLRAHGMIQTPDSYPPTTSGELEPSDDYEDAQQPGTVYESYPGVQREDTQNQRETQFTVPERGRQYRSEEPKAVQVVPTQRRTEPKIMPVVPVQHHQIASIQPSQQKPQTVDHVYTLPVSKQKKAAQKSATDFTAAAYKVPLPKTELPTKLVVDGPQPQSQNGYQDQNDEDSQEHENQEHEPHVLELDYPLPDLMKREFESLQNEPFDGLKPNEPEPVPDDISSLPLEQKLAKVAKENPDAQTRFFASLNIDEWEEAGDWFQKRFAEVFDKLKDARKARRQMAQKFEDEIKKRDESVVRKRKITEEALTDMKKTGSAVLMNTPQKKKQKKGSA